MTSLTFTRDGRTLIASTSAGKLRFWDIRRRKVTATVRGAGAERRPSSLSLSPDGRMLAALAEVEVKVWRLADRKEITTLPARGSSLAFSPDGSFLAVGNGGGWVTLRSTETWKQVRTLDDHLPENPEQDEPIAPDSLSFSCDGRLVAGTLLSRVALWKVT